ncbi:monocarboxylate transporter 7-like [Carassius auratus]|uniref:Monocarboxylate transporter 7-like n=1 Tax=Carassius auratus TaxID=7957 RepID=A0A6P6QJA3_CARAU|nr:monocarboxylate transporter 7-like [Carassius auratus]
MSNRFGFQPVVMFGGFLTSLGMISSSSSSSIIGQCCGVFSPGEVLCDLHTQELGAAHSLHSHCSTAFTSSISQMYLTIEIVTGLGYCLTFLPTITILSQYFSRCRSVVTAMASTGESFAIFAFAPAFTALTNLIGWRYTMVVIGTLQGTIIICGALLRPIVIKPKIFPAETDKKITCSFPEEQMQGSACFKDSGVQSLDELKQGLKSGKEQKEAEPLQISPKQQAMSTKNKLLDLTVLKEGSFLCYSAFGLFATLGFFTLQLYVVELSANLCTERGKAAYMLSTMAIAEIFGRLSIGWVLNWGHIRKIFILLGFLSLMSLVLVLFTVVNGFWGLAVCCVLYGFLLGNIASMHIPMLAEDDVVGIQRMPLAVGVYVCIQSFARLAGPPLGGLLVDVTQNYRAAFYSCAAGMGLGAIFLGFVRPSKTGQLCSRRKNRQKNPIVEQVCKDKLEEILEVDNQDIKS